MAALASALLAVLPSACKKVIGDSCTLNSDCSINADRICDLSQSGGYCTIPGCEPGSCPDNGVCVYFDDQSPRLRRRYCLAGCNDSSDCRDGYVCHHSDPDTCLTTTSEVPMAGQSCNRIADPRPAAASGWCSAH